MADIKATRLSKIAREFNVGISSIVDFLHKKDEKVDSSPNTKITPEQYELLLEEFSSDISIKKESDKLNLRHQTEQNQSKLPTEPEDEPEEQEVLIIKETTAKAPPLVAEDEKIKLKVVGKIDLKEKSSEEVPKEKSEEAIPEEKVLKDDLKDKEEVKEKKEKKNISDKAVDSSEKKKDDGSKVKVVGKIDLDSMNQRTRPQKKTKKQIKEEKAQAEEQKEATKEIKKELVADTKEEKELPAKESVVDEVIRAKVKKLNGPTVVGKMDLPEKVKKVDPDKGRAYDKRRKRKRIRKGKVKLDENKTNKNSADNTFRDKSKKKRKKRSLKQAVSEEDVQKQIKDTLAQLTKSKSKGAKYRREKREAVSQKLQEETLKEEESKNTLLVTEFVSVNELAVMMDVLATEVIATCMSLGLFVSINQRLDAETMSLVAEEFGHDVEFISVEVQEAIKEEEDKKEDLIPRPPIVTVMGHVDHGKTKLLDFIRHANVVDGEAGGITQHIGAYSVKLDNKKRITFLDTPGHEAFTAMRARGAQITDVVIIVVAADDGIKPQTVEAINHAQAAGVPMVFAINKIDKPNANPEKVKEELANMNILVEDWGGKFQSQEISAKNGINIEELLEKVLLEAEMLELKANPNKLALGTVVESSLDKGRGFTTTLLVHAGTMKIGSILLAGEHMGKVKAMYNERGKLLDEVGPATPVLVLGLNGAPQAGDKFNVMNSEKEAKEIANKREQLQREQGMRTTKHITLDEIGRRIAIGNFQELNIIVKGDVDGSVEALADSLIKLSTEEIQVNIKHKAVGQISEADILLAATSNAIVIGFQVRPSLGARKLAEKEEIDVRLYSIIYDAIEEIKSAMEGMLSPEIKEEITATLEILEVFKITKVGTIAGCMVKEGKIRRSSKVRVIRDGIVIYTGALGSLKRFKDDAKEVVSGQDCGLNIENFNDIKVGDNVEAYIETEVKKKL